MTSVVEMQYSGSNTCAIPGPQVLPATDLLRKQDQHRSQCCSAALSLLLVGLKGFHLQRCPRKRSTSASPPSCPESRQTENADAQGPPIVPRASVHATNRVETQHGVRRVQGYKKQSPGVKNPTQGTQSSDRAETTIHDSSLKSEQGS